MGANRTQEFIIFVMYSFKYEKDHLLCLIKNWREWDSCAATENGKKPKTKIFLGKHRIYPTIFTHNFPVEWPWFQSWVKSKTFYIYIFWVLTIFLLRKSLTKPRRFDFQHSLPKCPTIFLIILLFNPLIASHFVQPYVKGVITKKNKTLFFTEWKVLKTLRRTEN